MSNNAQAKAADAAIKMAGESGKKMALERFHPSRIAERHLEIYQEILK
jgi:signal recognition particle GTPase